MCTFDQKLQRNSTENRLKNKASKRDIQLSNKRLINDSHPRCTSNEGEITYEIYLKIDNTELAPETVALMIKDKFNL